MSALAVAGRREREQRTHTTGPVADVEGSTPAASAAVLDEADAVSCWPAAILVVAPAACPVVVASPPTTDDVSTTPAVNVARGRLAERVGSCRPPMGRAMAGRPARSRGARGMRRVRGASRMASGPGATRACGERGVVVEERRKSVRPAPEGGGGRGATTEEEERGGQAPGRVSRGRSLSREGRAQRDAPAGAERESAAAERGLASWPASTSRDEGSVDEGDAGRPEAGRPGRERRRSTFGPSLASGARQAQRGRTSRTPTEGSGRRTRARTGQRLVSRPAAEEVSWGSAQRRAARRPGKECRCSWAAVRDVQAQVLAPMVLALLSSCARICRPCSTTLAPAHHSSTGSLQGSNTTRRLSRRGSTTRDADRDDRLEGGKGAKKDQSEGCAGAILAREVSRGTQQRRRAATPHQAGANRQRGS